MNRLKGKSALITGAARGIGRGFAQKYIDEGKLSVANHIDFIEVTRETLDRTDLPPGLNKYKAHDDILMFIEAAQYQQRTQGTGKINGLTIPELGVTDVQAQDPEFKKLLTQQFTDTSTNVVDDGPALLETRMKNTAKVTIIP